MRHQISWTRLSVQHNRHAVGMSQKLHPVKQITSASLHNH
jgi:hypothetical protein